MKLLPRHELEQLSDSDLHDLADRSMIANPQFFNRDALIAALSRPGRPPRPSTNLQSRHAEPSVPGEETPFEDPEVLRRLGRTFEREFRQEQRHKAVNKRLAWANLERIKYQKRQEERLDQLEQKVRQKLAVRGMILADILRECLTNLDQIQTPEPTSVASTLPPLELSDWLPKERGRYPRIKYGYRGPLHRVCGCCQRTVDVRYIRREGCRFCCSL